jgi:hypothetical protein
VHWFVLAALGDAFTAILGCAGLLAGVWLLARSSRSDTGMPAPATGSEPPAPPTVPEPDAADADEPPATTFRHGAIRLAGDLAPGSESGPEPPAAPEFVPPPLPPAPRTSFRQGRIRLGGLERGSSSSRPDDEPPDAA